MSIQAMKELKTNFLNCVQGQMDHLKDVDTKEMGEVIDIIKDLSEAIYYCTITQSMQKTNNQEEKPTEYRTVNYYTQMPRERVKYYSQNPSTYDDYMPYDIKPDRIIHNPKEGKSYVYRKMYMDGKQQHKDKPFQIHELETYLQELSSDIVEMMKDSSSEQKEIFHQKMNNLINKIIK